MTREIQAILPAQLAIDDSDMRLFRALPGAARDAVGPFVFVDHYRSATARGIGDRPHPHAGIEVISYLLEGGMEHRDSMGFRDRLGPGDAQWIRAGRGILHAEQPSGPRHGLQLWTSLPPAEKFAAPAYRSWRADDIPKLERKGAWVDVIAGRVEDAEGPMVLATPTLFAHVRLQPDAAVALAVDAAAELAVYVIAGELAGGAGAALPAGSLAVLSAGDAVGLAASGQGAALAIIGGAPAARPILFGGPFVMDSVENLERAKRDFLAGKMGRLEGVPF
ncbi:MAG: pirin family protein [Rhodospirillales bacterium]|nr:pirin family protein [Rhodospirillales bacterium]